MKSAQSQPIPFSNERTEAGGSGAGEPFAAWLAELDALAAAEGCAEYTRQTGADAWREAFEDGYSPAEAWADEKSYAAEDAE